MSSSIEQWLQKIGFKDEIAQKYSNLLCENGYDSLTFLKSIDKHQLQEIDIRLKGHQNAIVSAIGKMMDETEKTSPSKTEALLIEKKSDDSHDCKEPTHLDPSGHPLKLVSFEQLITEYTGGCFMCDNCGVHYKCGSYHCSECNYDLCRSCYAVKDGKETPSKHDDIIECQKNEILLLKQQLYQSQNQIENAFNRIDTMKNIQNEYWAELVELRQNADEILAMDPIVEVDQNHVVDNVVMVESEDGPVAMYITQGSGPKRYQSDVRQTSVKKENE